MDWMNQRWANRKTASMGIWLITVPAMSRFQLVTCVPWNIDRPSCRGEFSGVVMMISGQRKSFHDHMNWMIARVASTGAESGRTILKKTPRREAPVLATLAIIQFMWSWNDFL